MSISPPDALQIASAEFWLWKVMAREGGPLIGIMQKPGMQNEGMREARGIPVVSYATRTTTDKYSV